jgi:sigma-54 dependent transcriptional regulator, acetoin dehydrogenase operon transcriptional activator AcoR
MPVRGPAGCPPGAGTRYIRGVAMTNTLSVVVSRTSAPRSHPALYIGLVADAPATPPARISLDGVDQVEIRRSEVRSVAVEPRDGASVVDIGLADARLSKHHARLVRRGTAWVLEDLGSKNGSWIKNVRIQSHALADGDVIIIGHTALVYRSRGGEAKTLLAAPAGAPLGLQTMSPVLEAQFRDLASAARSLVAVEITGETGTGKELVARAVHALSERPGSFIAVNCGALASTLVEGELFGHRRGAFTGAANERPGLIRSADQGTLFLDEIAELPAAAQASLLRVLQEKELTPVGADRPVRVDLRIVSATHQDLDEAVAAGRFRADLRARLLGVRVELPALRERPEDLGLLVAELLARGAAEQGAGAAIEFLSDVVAALYAYDWPLNIRELERTLAAATAVARDRIELSHLPPALRSAISDHVIIDEAALSATDRELRGRLTDAIARHRGNLAEVGRELGKDRTQIRRWMKRFGLSR